MELYSDIQLKIFRDRYAFDGEQFPHQAWDRIAKAVAIEEDSSGWWKDRFYDLLDGFRYVPGGRINHAMGTGSGVTAQNCYVIPVEDSRVSIMNALTEWVEIQSKGGGVGINLSPLRPRGAVVKGVEGTSSGPVNWAQPFAFLSKNVIQQGGSRRGAAMIMMDIDHPDIREFIHAKETPGVLEGCNISVCISNGFMEAVKKNASWDLKWNGNHYETVSAVELWDEICTAAWASAEPGIYFMERANDLANSKYFEDLISTNPCGEQPLGPYGACLLGSFNLKAFMFKGLDGEWKFDWTEFSRLIGYAVRFNDNIIDISNYPLEACEESQQSIRRMGMGVMGLADVLIMQEMRYGSTAALEFTEKVYRVLRDRAYEASTVLAEQRGSFPKFNSEEFLKAPFVQTLSEQTKGYIKNRGIRNCYLLTQAPTGTTSLLAGVNGGIEPYFDFDYERRDRTGTYDVSSSWAKEYNGKNRPSYLVTANDVTPMEHIAMQAAAQKYNDSSISKTANLPESATVQDIKNLYMAAWDQGLKSLSVYRDNSRHEQVLVHKTEAKAVVTPEVAPQGRRKPLPDTRNSITHKAVIDGQKAYIHIGLYEDSTPGEFFITMSKEGSTLAGLLNWGATMMSVALQWGVPLQALTEHMIGTQFEPAGFTGDKSIPHAYSVVDYIGRFAEGLFIEPPFESEIVPASASRSGVMCPECGAELRAEEGCMKCPRTNCFYSKC